MGKVPRGGRQRQRMSLGDEPENEVSGGWLKGASGVSKQLDDCDNLQHTRAGYPGDSGANAGPHATM